MATAAERRAARDAQDAGAPEAVESLPEDGASGDGPPKAAPRFYVATRDLFIQGVAAHRIGDTVPAEHVGKYGWGASVEDPGEDEEG